MEKNYADYVPANQLDLFFRVEDIKAILETDPYSIKVSLTFGLNGVEGTPAITIMAQGVDQNGLATSTGTGTCPWPCR